MTAGSNIIALRQLLRDKFPGLRTRADELPIRARGGWASGLPALDERLGGGFAKGLTEIVASHRTCGTASLITHILHQAADTGQFSALIDGSDCFDPASVQLPALRHLLWIRCHDADEALKATDLVLRDGNLPIVLLDLALATDAQLRKIPAPTWYRFQRIVEERGTIALIFTPRAMIAAAPTRVVARTEWSVDALGRDRAALLDEMEFEVREGRGGADEWLQRTA